MAKFKEMLSKNSRNRYSKTFTKAQNVDADAIAQRLMEEIPGKVSQNYGFNVVALPEPIVIGGLMGKKEYPGVLFSFPDNPDYATFLIGVSKIGGTLEIDVIQYGGVSKNMQHSNRANRNKEFSIKSLAKTAIHKALTDSNGVEEEQRHYDALESEIVIAIKGLAAKGGA